MTSPIPDFSHHFSPRNIPFGIASSDRHAEPQAVTRLGNTVLFLGTLASAHGLFSSVEGLVPGCLSQPTLNGFAALPQTVHKAVRDVIAGRVAANGGGGGAVEESFPADAREHVGKVKLHLPVQISDFTDFSCSLAHVKNAGRIMVGDANPPPAFFHLPVGYQGRSSSIVVSGTPVERPMGQYRSKGDPAKVVFGPSAAVDYEMEFAAIIGKPLPMRQRLRAADADAHIFGYVVLNDWSARDIQALEMVPLGPLNGKSMGTTISPWIVTPDALEPFRVRCSSANPAGATATATATADYLLDPEPSSYSVSMQVQVLTPAPAASATTTGLSRVDSLHWTPRHMVAHVASAGAALRTGDVMATGTVSGDGPGESGCLLEATEGGRKPLTLDNGSSRTYLQDGDLVLMTAWAGSTSPTTMDSGVGFGDCMGELLPSRPFLS